MNSAVAHEGEFSLKLLLIAITATLGGFLFGFDSAIINGTVTAVRGEFNLSAGMTGFTVSCALLGAMIGAWLAGYCATRFGRVNTMVISSVLLTASAVGSAFSYSVEALIFWRFVGGIGVGFASVIAPAYIAEIAPSSIRGRLATTQQMSIVIGIFMALLVGALLVKLSGGAAQPIFGELEAWRWMFLSEVIPSVLYGVLASRLPESPRYLIQNDRETEAREVLKNVVNIANDSAVDNAVAQIKGSFSTTVKRSFADLRSQKGFLLPIVWVGILLSVFQQLVGINVIFYFSTVLWNSVGFDESDAFAISVVTSFINVAATVVAIVLVDRIGRKPLLMMGSAIMCVSLAVMALAFGSSDTVNGQLTLPEPWGPVALVAANLFVIGFGISWGPVVWVLLGEMFPQPNSRPGPWLGRSSPVVSQLYDQHQLSRFGRSRITHRLRFLRHQCWPIVFVCLEICARNQRRYPGRYARALTGLLSCRSARQLSSLFHTL
ncbi:sugar porter family MFS transporter [Halioxenophilus aromaticivorans]|uniref:Sugar porter family MFS transporter n=1 Tax=Halioxenophilus aromaticivorans TaxID=1306992 RepID=A0AAV3U4U5_9ALTE